MNVRIPQVRVSEAGLTDDFGVPGGSSGETTWSPSSTPPVAESPTPNTSPAPSAESTGSNSSAAPVTTSRRSGSEGVGGAGRQDDAGKLRYDLLPWKAIRGLVQVLTFGAKKYTPNGWRTVPDAKNRYAAALLRHTSAIALGERIDPESGLRHCDHLLCNAAFLAELED